MTAGPTAARIFCCVDRMKMSWWPRRGKANGAQTSARNSARNSANGGGVAYPARPSARISNAPTDAYTQSLRSAYLGKLARLVDQHRHAVNALKRQADAFPKNSADRRQAAANLAAAERFLADTRDQYTLLRGTWRTWPYKITPDQRMELRGAYRRLANDLGARYAERQKRNPVRDASEDAIVGRIFDALMAGRAVNAKQEELFDAYVAEANRARKSRNKYLSPLQRKVLNAKDRADEFEAAWATPPPSPKAARKGPLAIRNNAYLVKLASAR